MAFNRLGGMFTDNPVNRVGPTGQPLIGGSNITDLLTRSAGGLLGVDMRSPEEKILAAQQGIDTTTPQGAIEAAKARLQFETDINARAQISNQIIQLQRQVASDNRQLAVDAQTSADAQKLAAMNAQAEPVLREAGYTELADIARRGNLTQTQITSNLSSISKDKLALQRTQGDLATAVLNTPELEGTEAQKLARNGELPDIPARFQLQYLQGLREDQKKSLFMRTVKARTGGNQIAKDLETGLITFSEAQKQASDLGKVSYGDVKFYKVGTEILPTREREQEDGTKDVVTWSVTGNQYVPIDETRLEKVPADRKPTPPRVVSEPSKAQNVQVLSAFDFEENTTNKQGEPFSNKEKLNELDSTTRQRVLRNITAKAAQLKAKNPGTSFSQHIQTAIEEEMNNIKFTAGVFNDTSKYTPTRSVNFQADGVVR